MAKAKVWNDNDYVHQEVFKGDKIVIEPHSFIEMDWEEAIQFKGQFTGLAPIKEEADEFGGVGEPDPRFFKKIRVEHVKPEDIFPEHGTFINPATGKVFTTRQALEADTRAYAAQNSHRLVADPELDKQRAAQSDEIKALKDQVERLTAMHAAQGEKKGPGRPKKEAV